MFRRKTIGGRRARGDIVGTGGSGFSGRQLIPAPIAEGHTVCEQARSEPG